MSNTRFILPCGEDYPGNVFDLYFPDTKPTIDPQRDSELIAYLRNHKDNEPRTINRHIVRYLIVNDPSFTGSRTTMSDRQHKRRQLRKLTGLYKPTLMSHKGSPVSIRIIYLEFTIFYLFKRESSQNLTEDLYPD